MSKRLVKVGDVVQGEVIGKVEAQGLQPTTFALGFGRMENRSITEEFFL